MCYTCITGNGVVVACVIPVLVMVITGNGIVVACVIPVLFYYR